MQTLQSNLTIDEVSKKITINGLKRILIIDYSSDVDFTEFVSVLAEYIDSDSIIAFDSTFSTEDDKLKKVIETITEIVTKYNENIAPSNTVEVFPIDNDDLPF